MLGLGPLVSCVCVRVGEVEMSCVSFRPCYPALPAEGERENAPRRSEVCGLVYSPDSGWVRLNFQLAF